jgi:AsmA protein
MQMKLLLKIGAGLIALVVVALIAFNLLISASAVRDRVAARVKEQTGRELTVNGSTSLLLMPSPHIVLTDVEIVDLQNRAGADLKVDRLALDVSFGQLFSREVDAKRVVMERPVFTVRLKQQSASIDQQGDVGPQHDKRAEAPLRFIAADAAGGSPRHDIMLDDVQIEEGTVRIIYDANGAERRIEKINANLSLPHLVDPLTAKGDFDWKGTRVGFDLKLASPADLDTQRSARLDLALDTDAIDANFAGTITAKPAFSAEGDLTAKTQSVPSLLAWMRQQPPTETAVGSGDLSSHVTWQAGEISFSQARFALSHATGHGQAVVTLSSPRPHVRAALLLETLDLNPFFAGSSRRAAQLGTSAPAEGTGSGEPSSSAGSGEKGDNERAATQGDETQGDTAAQSPPPSEAARKADRTASAKVAPAAFDADVNVNVKETKIARMTIGPTSLGLFLRDGVLDATLGGMQLYDGQGSGKFTLDASKPVPTFTGNLSLDSVSMQPLLDGAAGFKMLAGRAKVALQLNGTGGSGDEIKHSLAGSGSIDISDGSIEGINLTELIQGVGAGQMPNLEQGPGAKTAFSALGGTFNIASGVAETHDIEMTSPLLKVTARGTVDMVTSSLDFLTQPEIVAGPEGKGGANDLAGLTVPVRIEGPFDHPAFKPELKGMFTSPEQASKTINQIGDVLQKKFKGKPVGEAIGRMLGGVRIGKDRGNGAGAENAKPPASQEEEPDAEEAPPAESDKSRDPDLDNILR